MTEQEFFAIARRTRWQLVDRSIRTPDAPLVGPGGIEVRDMGCPLVFVQCVQKVPHLYFHPTVAAESLGLPKELAFRIVRGADSPLLSTEAQFLQSQDDRRWLMANLGMEIQQ